MSCLVTEGTVGTFWEYHEQTALHGRVVLVGGAGKATRSKTLREIDKIRTGPVYSSDYTLSDSDKGHGHSDATRPHTQPPPLSTSPWPFQS